MIRLNLRAASFIHRPGTFLNVSIAVVGFIGFIAAVGGLASLGDRIYPHAGTLSLIFLFALGILYACLSGLVALVQDFLLLFDSIGRHALTQLEKQRACVPAFALGAVVVFLACIQVWSAVFGIVLFFSLLAFSIQFPLLKDRWQRRRVDETAG